MDRVSNLYRVTLLDCVGTESGAWNIQSVSGEIVNILGDGSMDYSEQISSSSGRQLHRVFQEKK